MGIDHDLTACVFMQPLVVVANKCDVRRIAELPEDGQVSRSSVSLSAGSQNGGGKQVSRPSVFPVTVEATSLMV